MGFTMEEFVHDSLITLLKQHGQKDVLAIDDLVVSYVVSLLDDLSSDDDLLDAEAFKETLDAYLPEVEPVSKDTLKEWLFQVEKKWCDRVNESKRDSGGGLDIKRVIEATAMSKAKEKVVVTCEAPARTDIQDEKPPQGKRVNRLSETSDGGSEGSYEGDDWCQLVGPLLEMFPYSCSLEVNHCLQLTAGDVERTAQLIMHRHDTGQSLKPTDRRLMKAPKAKTDEKTLKQAIIGKYGYVDKEEDVRYHRPMIKKNEDKKLIRYRDGKIVSTKGERFTQVSKQESEEMKKTIKI